LQCKRCHRAAWTDDEKNTLDGQYCFTCRKKYGYYANSTFDDNSRLPKNLVIDALVDIPVSCGIAGPKTHWAWSVVKLDMAFYFGHLIVLIESDDGDGHSVSRGNDIKQVGDSLEI
jgi:hypothetical protein